MTNAHAATARLAHQESVPMADRFELLGMLALFGMAAFVQFSIAVAQLMLALAIVFWIAMLIARREGIAVPQFFWPLLAFGGATLVSAAFSDNPRLSFTDSKQLVLFLVVPIAYRLAQGQRGSQLLTMVMSLGGASAAYGIFQYGLLHYDQLSQRPQGTLGHYMTYSGLLMLVVGIAVAKLLFGKGERLWAALVMPALIFAVAITSTRTAWVGVCASTAVLLMMKDFRLIAVLPVSAALLFALAGPAVSERFASMFDRNDPTRRDRIAMLREGEHMVRAHPLVGVGPDMVKERYEEFRVPEAVQKINPHLHNVPVQIAAERGLPALALWLAFIVVLARGLSRLARDPAHYVLLATAVGALVSMFTAGLFEYNFGDSEFLMLFLLIVTLPFAAARPAGPGASAAAGTA